MRLFHLLLSICCLTLFAACSHSMPKARRFTASASAAAPGGRHPRIWLDSTTLSSLRAQQGSPSTGAARLIALCLDARANPTNYADPGYQGFSWANTLSACALSYQITQNPSDAQTALIYFNHLLDDDPVAGRNQGGDQVVQHDDGYGMRTFGVYAPLAYDWLHDAPGMTETLRGHARDRFAAWTSWYAASGYLAHTPGSNYECG